MLPGVVNFFPAPTFHLLQKASFPWSAVSPYLAKSLLLPARAPVSSEGRPQRSPLCAHRLGEPSFCHSLHHRYANLVSLPIHRIGSRASVDSKKSTDAQFSHANGVMFPCSLHISSCSVSHFYLACNSRGEQNSCCTVFLGE